MTPKGGAREGAGRKPLPAGGRKQQVSLVLPPSLVAWFDGEGKARGLSRSELIAEALAEYRARHGHPTTEPTD